MRARFVLLSYLGFWLVSGAFLGCSGVDDGGPSPSPGDVTQTPEDCPLWYPDLDEDGYGSSTAEPTNTCQRPENSVQNNSDCDDSNPATHLDAGEICDGQDNNCQGDVDENLIVTWYPDLDGDGRGDEAGAPLAACEQPPGYVSNDSDCDDTDPAVHRGAVELCDGLDNNCEGTVDEGATLLWYPDLDGDGAGSASSSAVESCEQPENLVANANDCNDANASIFPGAPDPTGDGVDQSCDGRDGLAPSVGLATSTFTSLQEALDAGLPGDTLWVGPGTYREFELSMKGKALTLASTDGASSTIIDAHDQGTVFIFDQLEGEGSVLRGFTLTGGYAARGGGLYLDSASPTLTQLMIAGNIASACGGGGYLLSAHAAFEQVTVSANHVVSELGACGGGLALDNSSPRLSLVTVVGNEAAVASGYGGGGFGGGLWVNNASPILEQVLIGGNDARGYASSGGGVFLYESSPSMNSVSVQENRVSGEWDAEGGGISVSRSTFTGTGLSVSNNAATATHYGRGGGIYFYQTSFPFSGLAVSGNRVSGNEALGGGLFFVNSNMSLTAIDVRDNESVGQVLASGGGLHVEYCAVEAQGHLMRNRAVSPQESRGGGLAVNGSVTLAGVVSGNAAHGSRAYGGGVWLDYSSGLLLSQATVVGNQVSGDDARGGGLYLLKELVTIENSIIAYNQGLNLYSGFPSLPQLSHSNLFQSHGASHNLMDLPSTVTEVDPGFVGFSDDDDPLNDDLHLRPGSPMRDAGAPETCSSETPSAGCDPDGSVSDLGAYGGSDAEFDYYLDTEGDGLYDGWEVRQTGGLTTLAGLADADGDGLSDDLELVHATQPQGKDSDGDSHEDGVEVAASTDPLNPFSVPGVEGLVVLDVPSTLYPTLQAALHAIPTGGEGSIRVAEGELYENLRLERKRVTVEGAGEVETILDGQQRDSVLVVENATLHLTGLTLQNGRTELGGGLRLVFAAGHLSAVTVRGSAATEGGGIFLRDGAPGMSDVSVLDNQASGSGGGLSLLQSRAQLERLAVSGNTAALQGGGLNLAYASPSLTQSEVSDNSAMNGGGLYLFESGPTLEEVAVSHNSASGWGGGILIDTSTPYLNRVTVQANVASGSENAGGGGVYNLGSSPVVTSTTIRGNRTSGDGGGLKLDGSSPTFFQVLISENSAGRSGGGIWGEDSYPLMTWMTIRENEATLDGGGVYCVSCLEQDYSAHWVIMENSAGNNGGGFYGTFEYDLPFVTVLHNRAGNDGGGIYLPGPGELLYVNVSSNEAGRNGGGLYMGPYNTDSGYGSVNLDNVNVTGNTALAGGGFFASGSSVEIQSSTIAYNYASRNGNIQNDQSAVVLGWSLFYNPPEWGTESVSVTGGNDNLLVEPQFLAYADRLSGEPCAPGPDVDCIPADLHPAVGSPLIDAGREDQRDVDDSLEDIGIFGDWLGGSWDVDGDGVPDYFWPGEWVDAPVGFDKAAYDCDDLDETVQACE